MKKLLVICLMCAFLLNVFLLSGCQDDNDNGDVESDEVQKMTLSVWVAYPFQANYKAVLSTEPNHPEAKLTKKIVDYFETKNKTYKLKMENKGWSDELNQNIVMALQAGTLPDIICGEIYMPSYIDLDILQPIELGELKDKIVPSAIYSGIKDNVVYAVPVSTGVFSLLSNSAVLKETGVDKIPSTWEEWLATSTKIKEFYSPKTQLKGGTMISGTSGIGSAFRALVFMRMAGGDFIDKSGNLTLNSKANVEALTFMRNINKQSPRGASSTSDDQLLVNSYLTGAAAFMIETPSYLSRYKGKDISTNPLPSVTSSSKKANVIVGNLMFGITKKSKNKEGATLFVKTLLDKEIQEEMYKKNYRIPVIRDVLSSLSTSTDPEMVKAYTVLKSSIDSMLNDEFTGGLPCFKKNSSKIWEKWTSLINNVLNKDNDIAELLKNAHKEIEELLK